MDEYNLISGYGRIQSDESTIILQRQPTDLRE